MNRALNKKPRRSRITLSPFALLLVPTLAILGLWGPGQGHPNAPEHFPRDSRPTSLGSPTSEDEGLGDTREQTPKRVQKIVEAARNEGSLSPRADEVDFLAVRALVERHEIGRARDSAVAFYKNHPDSPLVEAVHALTGRHLPPRGPTSPLER